MRWVLPSSALVLVLAAVLVLGFGPESREGDVLDAPAWRMETDQPTPVEACSTLAPVRSLVAPEPDHAVEDPHEACCARTITLIDESDSRPLPGAELFVLERQRIARIDFRFGWQISTPPPVWFRAYGERHVADAAGRVRVAAAGRGAWAFACQGDRWALHAVRGRQTSWPSSLMLRPERGLDVQALDSRGCPVAGVPVKLEWFDLKECGNATDQYRSEWIDHTAGANGLARIPHRSWLERNVETNDLGWRAPREHFAVRLAIPGAVPDRFLLDPREPHLEPIRLILPETGSVEVRVLGKGDRLISRTVTVRLSGECDGDDVLAQGGGGTVRFGHVAVGGQVSARVEVPGSDWAVARATGQGPRAAGDSAVLLVRLNERRQSFMRSSSTRPQVVPCPVRPAPAALLRGRVLVDREIPIRALLLSVNHKAAELDQGGRWQAGVAPGRVRIELRDRGDLMNVLHRVDDAVKSNEERELPEIDLRGRLTWIDLRVTDGEGIPEGREPYVLTRSGGDEILTEFVTDDFGRASTVTRSRSMDLYLAPGPEYVLQKRVARGAVHIDLSDPAEGSRWIPRDHLSGALLEWARARSAEIVE